MRRRAFLGGLGGSITVAEAHAMGWLRGGVGSGTTVPSFTGVTLDNFTWTTSGSAVTIGNVVASTDIAATLTGATLTVSDTTNFQFTNGAVYPCALQAKAGVAAGAYAGITLTIALAGIANTPFTGSPFTVTGSASGGLIALVRTFNQPTGTSTPADAFVSIGHPFIKGSSGGVPTGSIVTAALGGTTVRVQGVASVLESDGSLAWTNLLVDYSGVTVTPGSPLDLVLSVTSGSWSSTTSRTNADWTGLDDTVEITNLSTSGTSAPDMNGAGTWVATFDGGATNTITTISTGALGLMVKVVATFVNGATTHRFLQAISYYWVCQKADTTLGPVAKLGPYIANVLVFKTNPSQFNYDLNWKRGGVSQRTEIGVPHPALSFTTFPRFDGQWDWTASDPQIWVSQDYNLVRATKKIPPFATGTVYTGSAGTIMPVDITNVNTSTGVFTISATGGIFGSSLRPVSVDFTAGTLPSGITANTVYWAAHVGFRTFQLYDTLAHALAGGATGKIIPSTSGTSVVVRLNVAPATQGVYTISMAAAGSRPDIGIFSEWGAAYLVANTQDSQRLGRVMATILSGAPAWVINDATGKIPSLLNSGGTPAGLGTALPTTCWSTAWSSNIGGGAGPTLGSPANNGWAVDSTHFPNPFYPVWLMEGNPFLRDMLLLQGNRALAFNSYIPQRNFVLSGITYYGSAMFSVGHIVRRGAWNTRDIVEASFAAYEGSAEQTYFRTVLTNNCAQGEAYAAYKGADYSALGAIDYDEFDYPPQGKTLGYSSFEGFMLTYMGLAVNFAAVLQGDFVPGLITRADYVARWLVGVNTAMVSNYFATAYTFMARLSEFGAASPGSYVSSFAELGVALGGNGTKFNYASGTEIITMTTSTGAWTPGTGDKFRPANFYDLQTTPIALPIAPSPLTDGTDYTLASGTSTTLTLSAGNFASNVTGSGGGVIPSGQSAPSTGTLFGLTTTGDGYLAEQIAGLGMEAARGATGAATAFAAARARYTGNFNTVCGWGMQDSF